MCTALSALGYDIVTGAGPGLMQAANAGARAADATGRVRSIGVRVGERRVQESVEYGSH